MAVLTNMNLTSQSQVHLARSLERILEEAHLSGELNLSGRKLKDFPNSGGKYDLSDSVVVDLSKNRFIELPLDITNFWSLERLSCHHNNIKSIPDSVLFLQSLIYLDLSRNQLTCLPPSLCDLPLQSLLVSHNKLSSLPSELVRCSSLTELNVSCNQITHLPPSLGQLGSLRSLNVRNNLLLELPIELTYLRLTYLDLSCNRLASLPLEFRNMISLIDLDLNHNPLVSPPTTICMRGRVHVFKWLELRSSQGQDAGRKCVRKLSEANKCRTSRHALTAVNSDSGYSTGLEWQTTPPPSQTLSAQPSTVHLNRSDEGLNDYKKRMERSSSEREVNYKGLNNSSSVDGGKNGVGLSNGNGVNGEDLIHRQTYREYKEALKQQRSQENVYKRGNSHSSNSSESSPSPSGSCSVLTPPPSSQAPPISKPVQMVQPSRPASHQSTPTEHNGLDHSSSYIKPSNPPDHTPSYIKPAGPPPITPLNGRPPVQSAWQSPPLSTPPDKLNFTMRREYDKAKEEANLVNQLRQNIETRLKMSLPAELGPALSDGVVLCHLANHVRPRSVASIHVPSPAVPKLTMARCRRNVDNFLEACRKIGVEEGDLCDRDSIVTIARGSVCTLSNTVTRLLAREHPVYTEPETKVSDTVYEREACSPSVDAEKMFGEANGKSCETDWNVSVESRGLKFKSGETFSESMNGESKLNSNESNVKDHPMLRVDEASKHSTLMCLGGFLMALLVLYLFPLPS